ncbi:MAG: class I SAM-dependent methyltransferase [Acidimicrobiia bacterium]
MAPLTPLEQQQLDVTPSPTFWHRVRFELVAAHLRTRPTTAVLDVGAGSGLLGEHLRASGVRYRFTESSPALAASLVARFGASALDDGGPLTSDTVVTVLDVLEHVEDDAALLATLADRMQPGAGLVVTVPALARLFSSWDTDLGHFRRYSRRELEDLVTRHGFVVQEASYLFPELLAPAVLRKLRRSSGDAAEFPDLPRLVDRIATAVSRTTARLRRWWPAGTSVLVVAHRTADPVGVAP